MATRLRPLGGLLVAALLLPVACDGSGRELGSGATPVTAPALELASRDGITVEADRVPVVETTDGDTLVVRRDGRAERVRLLGINAPESEGGYRSAQCYGEEAGARVRELALGRPVVLGLDARQGPRDQHGRLLAYVWLPDGTLLNRVLLSEGAANEYTYDREQPYVLQRDFRAARDAAARAGLGLWSPDGCDGDFDAAPSSPRDG